MDLLLSEIRQAARRLLHAPTFCLAVAGTLALAIGADVAIYGVIRRVILRPLPYPESDRLVWLDHSALGIGAASGLDLTQGLYRLYSDRSRSLARIAVYRTQDMNLTAGAEPERVEVAAATSTLESTLRAAPELGRFFDAAEDVPGATLPVARVRTMDAVVGAASARLAFTALLLAMAAVMALLLGVVGTYGVIAYVVEHRTSEFGVRLALGATGWDIAGMMVRYGSGVVGAGMAAGLCGSVALTRVLRALLYGVSPTDPFTFLAVSVLVASAAFAAVVVPVRRAAAIDPVVALRPE